ncbi:CdaR family transcriptional regulator [Streptomyces sp. RTd22]|uniref:CdaR family transcriptional regulator n=1 Tax=Streptomyces sp. RTd22 TaxID=1841249 RepID=UPI0007C53043|nr:sugar diacid recognition domain-containing protein [Streptomyces sp. RTd22]
MLSPSLAQEIAGDTSAVIGFNVLITDSEGTVIGSGDRSRIGTFHEASVEVLRTQEPATHTTAQAQSLRGVRPGVTLPLVRDGHAVGTVGITGTPAQVGRFGLLVKRQTEILMRESVLLRSRVLRERVLEDLIADVASYDAQVVEPDFIVFRAAELGFDLRLARVAIAMEVTVPDAERRGGGRGHGSGYAGGHRARDTALVRPELLRTVREAFPDPQDIVASAAPGWIGVLHRLRGEALDPDVAAVCGRLTEVADARYGLVLRAGIGEPASSVGGLHDSYQDACDALRLGARVAADAPDAPVHLIGDLRGHQLLAAVGQHTRARLIALTATDLRGQPDWPVLRETVVAWCENGFNLVRASAALHIHRNTLVYRINKIEQISGRSLRDRRALSLYLACLADQLDTTHS